MKGSNIRAQETMKEFRNKRKEESDMLYTLYRQKYGLTTLVISMSTNLNV